MQADGKGWLYAPAGLADGPMPTHYEPQESPVANLLYPASSATRPASVFPHAHNRYNLSGDEPGATCTRTWSPRTGSPSTSPPAA